MRSVPSLVFVPVLLALAIGCASTSGPALSAGGTSGPQAVATVAAAAKPAKPRRTDSRTFRIGFWEFDLLAMDLQPRGITFRVLDLAIAKALEIGGGHDYHSVSVLEIPHLLNVLTTRHEGPTYEHRLADLQALALAALRMTKESERKHDAYLLKIPVAGSLYSHEVDGGTEKHSLFYVFGWTHER